MFINNIDLITFNAKVQEKRISHGSIKNTIEYTGGNIIEADEVSELSKLDIEIKFEDLNRFKTERNISNFLAQTKKCDIKFKNIEHFFKCYYVSHSIEPTGFDELLTLKITFEAIECENEKVEVLENNTTFVINNTGNVVTPARLEITPKAAFIDFTIEGLTDDPIKIKSLESGTTLIIDNPSIEDIEGNDNFEKVELWEFPRLLPEKNTIKVSRAEVTIKIKYNPRWL